MRVLFLPAIHFMNRMSYMARFMVLGVVGFLAIGMLLTQMVMSLSEAITSTRGEQHGVEVAKPLLRLIQASQQHRGLSSGVINGDASLVPKRQAKEADVSQAFAAVEQSLSPALAQAKEWQDAKAQWAQIQASGMSWAAPDNFARHTVAIRQLLDFLARVGEDSRLLLDPDFASSFMASMVVQRMPETLEPLGQLRARGTGILAKHLISDPQRVEISRLVSEVGVGTRGLSIAAHKAAHYAPHLQSTLTGPVDSFAQSFANVAKLVNEDVLGGVFATQPGAYFKMTTDVIDIGYRQLYDVLLPALEKELAEREQQLVKRLALNLGLAAIVLLVAAYLGMGSYYAVMEGIAQLSSDVTEIAKGDLRARVQLESEDELRDVGNSLNLMAEAVASLIRNVQQGAGNLTASAQSVSAASVQIADSSQTQSNSATNMAASVEQMTTGIDQLSHNAVQAYDAANESAQLSVDSGRKVQDVLQEIERIATVVGHTSHSISELETHSKQISTIVNVIRDIADQTNLLALNAAIEAARAGESGRGFAVVADEVRKLAERTALSTQEISNMVTAIENGTRSAVAAMEEGVERVNTGVTEAKLAGSAMDKVREHAQQVVLMVNDISVGLREQSAAAITVAQGIEQVAAMAQRNDQTVRGNVRTAAELERLATELQTDIRQFRV